MREGAGRRLWRYWAIVYKVELKFTFSCWFLDVYSLYVAYGEEALCDVFVDVLYSVKLV